MAPKNRDTSQGLASRRTQQIAMLPNSCKRKAHLTYYSVPHWSNTYTFPMNIHHLPLKMHILNQAHASDLFSYGSMYAAFG